MVCLLFLSFWNRSISAIGINRPKGVSRQANFCWRVSCLIYPDVISRARAAWLTVRNPSRRLFLSIFLSLETKKPELTLVGARAYLSAVSGYRVKCSFLNSIGQLWLEERSRPNARRVIPMLGCVKYILPVRIHLAPASRRGPPILFAKDRPDLWNQSPCSCSRYRVAMPRSSESPRIWLIRAVR